VTRRETIVCLSAEVDLVAGLLLVGVGVDAVRHVRGLNELPLAVLPLVFAAHQLIEAVLWWALVHEGHPGLVTTSVWVYLLIAFGLLPVLVPLAVAAIESQAGRYRLRPFVLIGVVVAALLLRAVVQGPIEASVRRSHIDYDVDLSHAGIVVTMYVVATCGSLLVSTLSAVRWYGLANLLAVAALTWLSSSGLISLWCA
jgi:hypothetical protein